jgi:hypothetical protein
MATIPYVCSIYYSSRASPTVIYQQAELRPVIRTFRRFQISLLHILLLDLTGPDWPGVDWTFKWLNLRLMAHGLTTLLSQDYQDTISQLISWMD